MTRFAISPLLLAGALALGCGTPKAAIQERTRLATLAEVQAQASAAEVDALVRYVVDDKRKEVEAAKMAEYNKAMNTVTTPEAGATLGYNLALDMAAIQASAEAEARRLGGISSKMRVVGSAVQTLNQMADDENKLAEYTANLLWDEALPASISMMEEVKAQADEDEAERLAKLAEDAAKAEADAEAEEEHAQEEHESEPTPAPTPTPTPTTPTGS